MRRRATHGFICASLAATLLPLAAGSAEAVDPAPVRVRSTTAPEVSALGIAPRVASCSSGAVTAQLAPAYGEYPAPAGVSSLKLSLGATTRQTTGLRKNYPAGTALSSLSDLSFSAYRTGSAPFSLPLYLDIVTAPDGDPAHGTETLEYAVPAATGWQRVEATNATFTTHDANMVPLQTTDLATYQADHPAASITAWEISNRCEGSVNTAAEIDLLRLSDSTGLTTIDFEAPTTLTPVTGYYPLYAGQRLPLKVAVRQGGAPIAGAPVAVLAKPYGADRYTVIGTTTSGMDGNAYFDVSPTTQTYYVFRVDANEPSYGGGISGPVKVDVRTYITVHVFDTTVTRTQPVTVWGLTKIAQPGTLIYLYQGPKAVASTKVQSDGTYLFVRLISVGGHYQLEVRGAAGNGRLAGQSAQVPVSVA